MQQIISIWKFLFYSRFTEGIQQLWSYLKGKRENVTVCLQTKLYIQLERLVNNLFSPANFKVPIGYLLTVMNNMNNARIFRFEGEGLIKNVLHEVRPYRPNIFTI